jgi:hypothetical protein
MEMAGDQDIEARRGSGCLGGKRGDFLSHANSLRRLVVKQRVSGAVCHERARIGDHRVDGVQIATNNGASLGPPSVATGVKDGGGPKAEANGRVITPNLGALAG